jgi:plasmid stabilization system protein ParE
MIFDFHPAADAELRAAIRWYEEQESELGTRFEAAVYESLARIGASPRAWKPWSENPAVRIFSLWRFPFHIPYVSEGSRIIVLAVAHSKREPGYWRDRMNWIGGSR